MKKLFVLMITILSISASASSTQVQECVKEAIEGRFAELNVKASSVKKANIPFVSDFSFSALIAGEEEVEVRGNVKIDRDECRLWKEEKTMMGIVILELFDLDGKLVGLIEGSMIY